MKSLSYLNKYFLKYKWQLLLGVLFIIIQNVLVIEMPELVKDAVNDFQEKIAANETIDNIAWLAFSLAGMYFLLSLTKGIFLFFTRQTIIKVSRYVEYDLKNEIYEHYQKLNFNFYKRNSTGDLLNRISEDVSKVRMYLGPGVMYTVNLVFLFSFIFWRMLSINVELTLWVLTPLPIMSFMVYKVSDRMNKQSERVQREQSKLSSIVQETFSGVRVLKAYGAEEGFNKIFNESNENYLKRNMDLVFTNALFMPTIVFLIGISTTITIFIGGNMYIDGVITNPGVIVQFVMYVNLMTWPFASVGWVTSLIQRAAASQERINEFLKQEPDIVNPTQEVLDFQGNIEFNNVTYTYPTSNITAVKNLSFTINKGETLAILGRTGSGKSSVIHLLMRQFDPQEGEVLIDNKNLKEVNLEEYRKDTGVVPQEVFLFSDSIANNIKFGLTEDRDASQEELDEVTKQAHVYHNIVDFKEGYDTLLGERGVNLSGGQKQRISIARALMRKPKFLILDDCLSAVDTETEEIILSNLKPQIEKNTTLIVSHRVSSIRNADKIIVLDDGEKIEEGTHQSLMQLNGIYAEMYQKQLLEEEESKKQVENN
ncbi:ATP-binding cassette, subfamily B [Lishizhenia tianjinensis]|uniref:ATP-binding cassette, subfamily B n=1 Tax=Lishizhenia tianjinensis TaxID=477690 RepID=A0A1I6YGC0_9FLAO|nr:ABC transporter ATP-binding protein [Lishizhenia tianjinensis]SFT49438.1 ATP-binding cassette, subfamily B [Lishizhenia tianjinensis]